VCLYTHETAHSRDYIIQIDDVGIYESLKEYVTTHFGPNRMDNRITLVLKPINRSGVVYATMWDGKLHIGSDIHMFVNLENPANKHRTVLPIKETIKNIINKI
jgi:hypothetical protein